MDAKTLPVLGFTVEGATIGLLNKFKREFFICAVFEPRQGVFPPAQYPTVLLVYHTKLRRPFPLVTKIFDDKKPHQ
jgi:hypothetical protein